MHDMQHTPKNVDDIFAQRLRDAELKAPDGVWQGIADALETDRLRKKVIWAQLTAAASLVMLLGFGAWYFFFGRVQIQATQFAPVYAHQVEGQHALPKTTDHIASLRECLEETQPTIQGVLPTDLLAQRQLHSTSPNARLAARLINKLQLRRIERITPGASLQPALQQREEIGMPTMAFEPEMSGSILELQQALPLQINPYFAQQYPSQRKSTPKAPDDILDEPEAADAPKAHAFTVGGTASPDFSFASQTPVSMAKVASSSKNALPENAVTASRRNTPSTAVTTGMRFGYALSERFGLQTGLLFTRRITERDHAITQTGEAEAVETRFNVNSIEVPATIKYNVIDHPKFDYYVNSGVSATLFMNYKQSLVTGSGIAQQKLSAEGSAGTPAQASVLASTGVQMQLGKRISMNIEPGLRYGIYVTDYSFTQRHPLSFNAFSGINYHF